MVYSNYYIYFPSYLYIACVSRGIIGYINNSYYAYQSLDAAGQVREKRAEIGNYFS